MIYGRELRRKNVMKKQKPLVGIIMGSKSDWPTMKNAAEVLAKLGIPHEKRIVSAHRTPDLMATYAKMARGRGIQVIIAGAGGAAHLPGMVAAHTNLPVLGVPVRSRALQGLDSLLSIAQMPAGIPVGTLAIGEAGATNAALLAASIYPSAMGGCTGRWKNSGRGRPKASGHQASCRHERCSRSGQPYRVDGRRATRAHVHPRGAKHGLPGERFCPGG